MSNSNAAPQFPYDHLGILGFEKLRRYVPPKRQSANDAAAPDSSETPATPAPPTPESGDRR
ncbi:MAG: hypothetical protein JWP97_243 [Labilithrix sp.]|nr:hypothetical protein [Labilithrix sp.]